MNGQGNEKKENNVVDNESLYEKTKNKLLIKNYYGDSWKPSLADFSSKTRSLKSFEQLISLWDSKFAWIDSFFAKTVGPYNPAAYAANAKNRFLRFKEIVDFYSKNPEDGQATNQITSQYELFVQELSNLRYFQDDSIVGTGIRRVIVNGVNPQFCAGFIQYYMLESGFGGYQVNKDFVDGYAYAAYQNGSYDLTNPGDTVKAIVEETKTLTLDAHKLIAKTIEGNASIVSKWESDITLKNESFKKLVEEIEGQKNLLMLSGPMEIWYKKLTKYTGINYEKKDGNRFEYKASEKAKKPWSYKFRSLWGFGKDDGRITQDKRQSIFFGGLGLVVLAAFVATVYYLVSSNFADIARIAVIISVAGSFGLFIYGYILRILVKNWITSRHIAEEIEERISLTQFYLTLIVDKKLDNENGVFALREIFKRIHTGLIKESPELSAPFNFSDLASKIKGT